MQGVQRLDRCAGFGLGRGHEGPLPHSPQDQEQ
jgi:hypothetical protein